ncbi:hypothetical protein [Micromonospora eburnea]|uniref:Uncharacterized protein n=1 Tax=Micromonospora eburnea TaxID=227316 RepID=A0A1C6URZ8_9ACTN|nr:hypothetical protein [Micromonospora eburnea]SCL56855.1 hypothetical protein GA0070604_3499 [Micromonospora eburnea]
MTGRRLLRYIKLARWALLGAAMAILLVFLAAQPQSIDVSYGQSPAPSKRTLEGDADELSDATVPSTAEMSAMVDAAPVVRLPGSVASWDEQRVRAAIGDQDIRILVAPPGLDAAERERVREVANAAVQVLGTEVSSGLRQAVGSTIPGWRAQFATGDVTNQLVTLIAKLRDAPPPADRDELRWREPSGPELAAVLADLRANGLHVGAGATLTRLPEDPARAAFPGGAWYVVLPAQPYGRPLPRYGPALARLFPDRPIVVMYGNWIEYHGPAAADFADLAGTIFYAQFGNRLSQYDYPQQNVLGAYLNQVTAIRYAGLFDRPLPYRAFDPLRVALPALPWVFAGCVAGFMMLSIRSLRRSGILGGRLDDLPLSTTTARLAGLTALAVEVSLLTDARSNPALTRGIGKLQAARTALDEGLPDRHARKLLDDAAAELDDTARMVGIPGYRPARYLQERVF